MRQGCNNYNQQNTQGTAEGYKQNKFTSGRSAKTIHQQMEKTKL